MFRAGILTGRLSGIQIFSIIHNSNMTLVLNGMNRMRQALFGKRKHMCLHSEVIWVGGMLNIVKSVERSLEL
jgi:hypothetical protein